VGEGPIIPICRRLGLALGLIALGGPAFADSGGAAFSAYVRGRAAEAAGAGDAAVAEYRSALDASPASQIVAIRAYRAAVAAGDYALVARAAAVLEAAGVAPADAALFALAEAIRADDTPATDRAIATLAKGPLGFIEPVVTAWRVAASDPKAALVALDRGAGQALGRRYASENRALLLIAMGRVDDGLAMLRPLIAIDQGGGGLRLDAAQLLAGQGKQAEARALLGDAAAGDVPAALPSFAFGVSRLAARLASDVGDDAAPRVPIALARVALRIDPGNDQARLLLADGLAAQGDMAAALALLDQIAPTGPVANAARSRRFDIVADGGDAAAALTLAAARVDARDATAADWRRYAGALLRAKRPGDAAAAYQRAIDLAGKDADWTYYLQAGGAYDQAGRWTEAKPLLERAAAMAPDQPVALNYLGYSLLEQGGDRATALKLIERANGLRPDDLSIVDSLGWAWFKLGDTARALPLLERAAQGDPPNATVIEHLGDAYWRVGRRYEARYAWGAAAAQVDGADARRIAAKLADGSEGVSEGQP